jgi:hypothetical protein
MALLTTSPSTTAPLPHKKFKIFTQVPTQQSTPATEQHRFHKAFRIKPQRVMRKGKLSLIHR